MAPAERRRRRRPGREQRRATRRETGRGEQPPGPPDPAAGWERYRVARRLVSVGDDYIVETAAGEPAFFADGDASRVRETLELRDLRTGDEYGSRERPDCIGATIAIKRNGRTVATVHKAPFGPLRDRFGVSTDGTGELRIVGSVLDYEYRIMRDDRRVATVSKGWFRVQDTYGIEVSTAEDAGLVVAYAVVLDAMARPER